MRNLWPITILGAAALTLAACGTATDGGSIAPSSPSINFVNPPSSVVLGQTVLFQVDVRTPAGARGSNFLEIRTFDPFGQGSAARFLNANEFGSCAAGATFCSSANTIGFQPNFGSQVGVWRIEVRAFDQLNNSATTSTSINVFN